MATRKLIKTYLLTYLAVLAGVFVLFSLLDTNGDYVVERKLWQINHKYADVIKNHETASPQVLEQVTEKYRDVIKHYGKSKAIPGVYMVLARVYLIKGDLDKSREVAQELMKLFPDYRELCAEAASLIGKTYETEDNWPQAKEIYEKVILEYPTTTAGLTMPLYIANYYQGANDFKNTMSSYARAIDFYKKIIAENPKSNLEFESLRNLANCYVAQNRWTESVDTLKQLLMKYPSEKYLTAQRAELIIKTINTIVSTQIKDYDVAINIYTDFMQRYPKHPLTKTLKILVDRLNELKASPAAAGNS